MNRFRALFLGFATATSAAALAAYNGVFDGPANAPTEAAAPAAVKAAEPAATAAKTDPAAADASKTSDKLAEAAKAEPAAKMDALAVTEAGTADEKPVEVAKADPAALAEAKPAAPEAAAPAVKADSPVAVAALAPEFGLLRAEPDGSLLVAGKGAPNADIELVTGDTVLGKTKAEANGDFALVLNDPLKAGDYSMVLRTTNPDGKVATSVQTAIVAIPQDLKGEVLAMVEEPGKASRIINAPAAAKPADIAAAEPVKPADAPQTAETAKTDAPAADPAKQETVASAEPETPAAAAERPKKLIIPLASVAVEAVEIEGNKIFVAGSAPAGSTIRIYATEMLLGETKATENDRFLLEASRDLAVGDYFIHADTIGKDGKLISRVTVPFTREAGETLAAVAAPASSEAAKEPASAETAKTVEPAASEPDPAKSTETATAGPSAPATEPETEIAAAPAEPEVQAAAKTADAASETVAPALTKVDASVIIRRGDSLWRISRRVYGRGVRYSTIYLANKDKVTNPDRIWPGQVMMIPEKTSEGEAANMAEIEKRKKDALAQ
jgi:nucleoid-associated protein YgaU